MKFLERLYAQQLTVEEQVDSDDEKVMQHRAYELRAYLLYLVGASIFMDNSAYYVDVVYLKYFADMEHIHKYN